LAKFLSEIIALNFDHILRQKWLPNLVTLLASSPFTFLNFFTKIGDRSFNQVCVAANLLDWLG
jgi:hypothetical protein